MKPVAEGTIRFSCTLEPCGNGLPEPHVRELDAWRTLLRRLGLIGRDEHRYGGFGFGNLSVRDPHDRRCFFVTGSQTGQLPTLESRHFTRVLEWSLERFAVRAEGELPPSSEALTHALIFDADASVQSVFHVHDPDTWAMVYQLALPATPERVGYGTPEMASAVSGLLAGHRTRPLVFATLGHEDGIFACGRSVSEAGRALVGSLALALAAR